MLLNKEAVRTILHSPPPLKYNLRVPVVNVPITQYIVYNRMVMNARNLYLLLGLIALRLILLSPARNTNLGPSEK